MGIHTGLFDSPIHLLELVDGILLYMMLNDFDTLVIFSEVWSVAVQTDHIQCLCGLQRSMEMKILARVLGGVQVCRQSAVKNGLSMVKIGVWQVLAGECWEASRDEWLAFEVLGHFGVGFVQTVNSGKIGREQKSRSAFKVNVDGRLRNWIVLEACYRGCHASLDGLEGGYGFGLFQRAREVGGPIVGGGEMDSGDVLQTFLGQLMADLVEKIVESSVGAGEKGVCGAVDGTFAGAAVGSAQERRHSGSLEARRNGGQRQRTRQQETCGRAAYEYLLLVRHCGLGASPMVSVAIGILSASCRG